MESGSKGQIRDKIQHFSIYLEIRSSDYLSFLVQSWIKVKVQNDRKNK